ncbi:tetratricopeptide repeat protein [bacterium]|nr:tetratricopeptide repeat protein [bacterium]
MKKNHPLNSERIHLFRLFAATFLFLANKISGFDIWTHLAYGRHIFGNISDFPQIKEPLLYTMGEYNLSFQSWFFQLIVYFVNHIFGPPGLVFFNALIGMLAAFFLFKAAVRAGSTVESATLAIIISLPLFVIRFTVRPEIFLYLSVALVIYLLTLCRNGNLRYLLFIPLIQAVLVNFHPSGLAIIIILFFYLMSELLSVFTEHSPLNKRRSLTLFAILVLTIIASSFNPSGANNLLTPVKLVFNKSVVPHMSALSKGERSAGNGPDVLTGITEMMPIYEVGDYYFNLYLAYVVIVALSFLPAIRRKEFNLISFLMFAFFASLPLIAARSIGILPVVSAPIFARNMSGSINLSFKKTLIAVLLIVVAFNWTSFRNKGFGIAKEWFPVGAADFLLTEKIEGNIFNPFDSGGYLGWRFYPKYKVFINGTVSGKVLKEESIVFDSIGDWKGVLEKYKVNLIITKSTYYHNGGLFKFISTLYHDRGWVLIYQDINSLVFVREGTNENLMKYSLQKTRIWDEVVSEANIHILEDPKKEKVWKTLSYAYFMQGRFKDAIKACEKGLEYQPEDISLRKTIKVLNAYRR